MIELNLCDKLPFAEITISHNGHVVMIPNVLVDTGSVSTIISVETASLIAGLR